MSKVARFNIELVLAITEGGNTSMMTWVSQGIVKARETFLPDVQPYLYMPANEQLINYWTSYASERPFAASQKTPDANRRY